MEDVYYRSVEWETLNLEESETLKIILKGRGVSKEELSKFIGISYASVFNKLNRDFRWKRVELDRTLEYLGLTREKLSEISKDKFMKFVLWGE